MDEYNLYFDSEEDGTYFRVKPIEMWLFQEEELSTDVWRPSLYRKIYDLVDEADLNECLSSPVEYIRECKLFLVRRKIELL